MLRKVFTSAALGLSLAAPLAAPQAARADHWEHHHRHHREFKVFFRRDCYCEWRCAGCYCCYDEARQAACYYRERGFEVSIRD
jgi:hypothetical protein